MRAHLGLIVLLLSCTHAKPAAPTNAPPPTTSGAVFVGCGYLFLANEGRTPFSVLLRAEQARQIPGKDLVLVLDDVLVEIQLTTARVIGSPEARGLELLQTHQKWEAEYTSRINAWPALQVTSTPLDYGISGMAALMWGYDCPGKLQVLGKSVDRMAYVTAAIDDAVLVLAVPLRPGDDVKGPAQKVGQIMRSVKRLDHPVDLQALSAEVKGARAPWRDCR
jgi:hypothetical protein